mmetsp:Transcript_6353/g.9233  ORF Transcript_6353/g.9233 Transcript_6353/m.9233 type:complete len:456 (-) Transcript_6353:139-1506(-)|eukprot:CAMPEP_0184858406 /NCGR_PEP_ID=MMETSP0580-20130426/3515_1 /TAXON_ID=1118495 /ORGANISM="Dactyliosolen fragilissimus" /LENGTH=455 /DNA_ID=CAMNT_0027354531 /DNA_START=86 /DNA_END=1453 /DNA_ORIENTATION=-
MTSNNKFATHAAAALAGAFSCVAIQSWYSCLSILNYSDKEEWNDDETNLFKSDIDRTDLNKGNTLSLVSSKVSTTPITIFKPNPNLEIAYDARTRNPVYALERLVINKRKGNNQGDDQSRNNNNRKGIRFYEEKNIPISSRSRNGSYRNSSYDRGHMAPSADFSHSKKEMTDTFNLCNVSPQVPVLNRLVWHKLEELVRQLADKEINDRELIGGKVHANENELDEIISYVISGPLWLPSNRISSNRSVSENKNRQQTYQYCFSGIGIPPNIVQVPTHFFKVIIMMSNPTTSSSTTKIIKSTKFAAFVLPNDNFERHNEINLADYIVRLSELQAVSGLSFFTFVHQLINKDADTRNLVHLENITNVSDILTEKVWEENVSLTTGKQKLDMGSVLLPCGKDKVISRTKKVLQRRKSFEQDMHMLPCADNLLQLEHLCKSGKCKTNITLHKHKNKKIY